MSHNQSYEYCHEAGHAVARVLAGGTLLLVVGDPNGPMTEEQRALYASGNRIAGERGSCLSRCGERTCACGGEVKNDPENQLLSRFSLNLECEACLEIFVDEVASIVAGGIATALLMPIEHRDMYAQFDVEAADRVLAELEKARYCQVAERAMQRAAEWVQQEAKAILALTDALVESGGVLGGPEAERIVRANLSVSVISTLKSD